MRHQCPALAFNSLGYGAINPGNCCGVTILYSLTARLFKCGNIIIMLALYLKALVGI